MNIWAIIPARGGSKGVPQKNVRDLCGKPLIAWTIEEAKKSKYISKVIVNTDDEEIANVSKLFGAEIYNRPKELAQDLSLDLPVFEDHLSVLKKEGNLPEIIVDLRATAPLRRVNRIDEGIEILMNAGKEKADSVRAVSKACKHPYKMWKMTDGMLNPLLENGTDYSDPHDAPRQGLPAVYQNNGSMNAFWPETILEKKSMTGKKILGYVMEDWESVNIDTEFDFILAEHLMKKHQQND
ncbi:acylneuraminate cytidylyltransferase family protein [Candidatus Giovannonibacteria bacterium]|nr:acylneuraminate cytidylyltransferase family protein [Candidatus Giovannonibacteria bacterium]